MEVKIEYHNTLCTHNHGVQIWNSLHIGKNDTAQQPPVNYAGIDAQCP